MSTPDDAQYVRISPRLRRSPALSDADVARLLRGQPLDGPSDVSGAATFTAALRSLPQEPATPNPALTQLLADGFAPGTVTPAPRSAPRPVRSALVRVAGASLLVKVLTGTGVAVAAVVTAATTGVLPGPVEGGISGILDAVTPSGRGPANAPPAPADLPRPVPQPTESVPAAAPLEPSTAPAPRPTAVPGPRATAVPPPARPGSPASTRPEQAPAQNARPSEAPGQPPAARPSPAAARPSPESSGRPMRRGASPGPGPG